MSNTVASGADALAERLEQGAQALAAVAHDDAPLTCQFLLEDHASATAIITWPGYAQR